MLTRIVQDFGVQASAACGTTIAVATIVTPHAAWVLIPWATLAAFAVVDAARDTAAP